MAAKSDVASSRRNVLLVCLDTVRADYFRRHATRLRQLADVSFTECRAASSWTVPSHASMFTGEVPSRHGVHTHRRRFDSIPRERTFLDDLDEHATFGVSANAFASTAYGFDAWFDEFSDVQPQHRYPEATSLVEFSRESDATGVRKYAGYLRSAMRDDHPVLSLKNTALGQIRNVTKRGPLPNLVDEGASAVLRAAERHVDRTDEPYFGFLNIMDAHTPLEPYWAFRSALDGVPGSWSSTQHGVWELMNEPDRHEEYWRARKEVYGATIAYLDRLIAEFALGVLDRADRETTILVTADHGENLGDEADGYLANHKSSLSEGVLHVPLCVINPPDGYDRREDGYVSQLDLGELVVGMAGNETPDVFRDSLPAELVGMSAGPEPPSDYEYWDRAMRCVYEGTSKTVWDSLGNCDTYELDPVRPCWQRETGADDVVPTAESEFFDEPIEEAKATARNNENAEDDVTDATKSRLEELGYL